MKTRTKVIIGVGGGLLVLSAIGGALDSDTTVTVEQAPAPTTAAAPSTEAPTTTAPPTTAPPTSAAPVEEQCIDLVIRAWLLADTSEDYELIAEAALDSLQGCTSVEWVDATVEWWEGVIDRATAEEYLA